MLHISPEAVVPSKGEFMTRPRATQGSHEIDVSHGSQKRPARSESIIETSPASLGELKEGIEVGDFLKFIISATVIDFRRQLNRFWNSAKLNLFWSLVLLYYCI
jgi:hypothetical protein